VTYKMLVYEFRGLKEVENIPTLTTANRILHIYHMITLHGLILYFQSVRVMEQKTSVIFHTFYKLSRTFAALRQRGEEILWKSLLSVHYTTPYFVFYTLKVNLLILFRLIIAYNGNRNLQPQN